MTKPVILSTLKNPITAYLNESPQRITSDPGCTTHYVLNSRTTISPGDSSPYHFTTTKGDLLSSQASRISPVSIASPQPT